MGSGGWSEASYKSYINTTGRTYDDISKKMSSPMSSQQMFHRHQIHTSMNLYNKIRECRDNEEHPNTIPVILALDVTGSMGRTALEIAQSLNPIVSRLYNSVKDVEFMIMGIGDLECDEGPIQGSQFESDVRIAEAIDNIWFEGHGGGNAYESYTAAWYYGTFCCKLDCWKRNKKGLIITMGDEQLNPYLPSNALNKSLGTLAQDVVQTRELYDAAKKKFDIHHINLDHGQLSLRCAYGNGSNPISDSWSILGQNYHNIVSVNHLEDCIVQIVESFAANQNNSIKNDQIIFTNTKPAAAEPAESTSVFGFQNNISW